VLARLLLPLLADTLFIAAAWRLRRLATLTDPLMR